MFQLVVLKKIDSSLWTEGRQVPGSIIWVRSAEAARHLVEGGLARWPQSAPSEIKPLEPSERKSFANRMVGPSIGLQSSNARGPKRPLLVSQVALVLPKRV